MEIHIFSMVCQTLSVNSDCRFLTVECFYFYNTPQLHYKYNKVHGQFSFPVHPWCHLSHLFRLLLCLAFPLPFSFEALKLNWAQRVIIAKLLSFTYLQFSGRSTVQCTCKGASTHDSRTQTENCKFILSSRLLHSNTLKCFDTFCCVSSGYSYKYI